MEKEVETTVILGVRQGLFEGSCLHSLLDTSELL